MYFLPAIESTFFAAYRHWGNLFGQVYENGPTCAIQTGIATADLNAAWAQAPLTRNEKHIIGGVKRFFGNAGLPFWWWLFPSSQTSETTGLLVNEGFSRVGSIPCMLAELNAFTEKLSFPAGLQIIQVANQEEMLLWESVSFTAFDFPAETRHQYSRFVATFDLGHDTNQHFFLAFLDGKPVATSLSYFQNQYAGIYFVATLKEHRKKGIGLAITQSTMHHAKMAGSLYATLQSSRDGLSVYRQAGFKEYGRADVYEILK